MISPDAINPDWPKRTPDTLEALGSSTKFSAEQAHDALEVMQQYLDHPPIPPSDKTPVQQMAVLHQRRADWIDAELKPLVEHYLCGKDTLDDFKFKIQGFHMRHQGFGFLGPFGMMFFHMLVNCADKTGFRPECEKETREAIKMPVNEDGARSQIGKFEEFVHRVRQAHKKTHGTTSGCPSERAIPFFLSFFWQIQNRYVWPICYTNAFHSMEELNLWKPTRHLGEDYVTFKHLYGELVRLFTAKSGKPFDFCGVEHVFWFTGAHPDI